jgi:DNA-binding IclR family transcriptional regulator
VLVLFRRHKGEWLGHADICLKIGGVPAEVGRLLPVLAESYVLELDRDTGRYRYLGDALSTYEIDTFLRRVDAHKRHSDTNIARFRERYGS